MQVSTHTHSFLIIILIIRHILSFAWIDGFPLLCCRRIQLKGQTFILKLFRVPAPSKSASLFWLVRFGIKKVPLAWNELLSVMELGLFTS